MLRNGHVRFGGQPAETHQSKDWQSAAGRPYTQHRASDSWVYCCAVMDAWSRRIVGWSIADHIRTELVIEAIDMAEWIQAWRNPRRRHSGLGMRSPTSPKPSPTPARKQHDLTNRNCPEEPARLLSPEVDITPLIHSWKPANSDPNHHHKLRKADNAQGCAAAEIDNRLLRLGLHD